MAILHRRSAGLPKSKCGYRCIAPAVSSNGDGMLCQSVIGTALKCVTVNEIAYFTREVKNLERFCSIARCLCSLVTNGPRIHGGGYGALAEDFEIIGVKQIKLNHNGCSARYPERICLFILDVFYPC